MKHQVTRRVSVSQTIYEDWYEFSFGDKKDRKVSFYYINTRSGKVSVKTHLNFREAFALACRRADDGRYKNFIFEINDYVAE